MESIIEKKTSKWNEPSILNNDSTTENFQIMNMKYKLNFVTEKIINSCFDNNKIFKFHKKKI